MQQMLKLSTVIDIKLFHYVQTYILLFPQHTNAEISDIIYGLQ